MKSHTYHQINIQTPYAQDYTLISKIQILSLISVEFPKENTEKINHVLDYAEEDAGS